MIAQKKSTFWIFLVTLLSMLMISAAPLAPGFTRLTIINRTGKKVYIHLYYEATNIKDSLTHNFVAGKGTHEFIVEKYLYAADFRGCGDRKARNLDLTTQTQITFPECGKTTKHGERKMLKIILKK